MPIAITSLTTALLLLLQVGLTFYVIAHRISGKVLVGDGNDQTLIKRMRIHANFTEVVPITLIAMALLELQQGSPTILWSCAAMLITGRVLHPIGMQGYKWLKLRQLGMVLTVFAMLTCSISLIITIT